VLPVSKHILLIKDSATPQMTLMWLWYSKSNVKQQGTAY